jgi:Calcineurin-like phosphoesterase
MNRTHLIIPDVHCHAEYGNERLTALGNFIVEERPTDIICIGDFPDMSSLSSYDEGKASFEGRRYHLDIDAALDGQEKLFNPIREYRRRSHRPYNPHLVMCLGNHDYRIIRAVEEDPKLQGTIGIHNLKYEDYGWEVHNFLEPVNVHGINYCHYFASGVAGRAISGEAIGRTMCNKLHASAVQGHSHLWDHAEKTAVSGQKIFGLSCGSYTHPQMIEDWNRATYKFWWRGIVMLHEVDGQGYYDEIRGITEHKLLREYL